MKKVGIATFQFADNYGAVLQCYALQKIINSFDCISANVINYIPSRYKYHRIWETEENKIKWIKKRERFKKFLLEQCNMELHESSVIVADNYDVVCVGSDQVWNPLWDYREYFLPNVGTNIKKIAYAASVGCSCEEAKKRKEIFAKYLPSFSEISVREEEHVDFISDIIGRKCQCVADPTLLLNADDYADIMLNEEPTDKEKYLLFYWLEHNQDMYMVAPIVNRISAERGLKIKHTIWRRESDILFPEGECVFYESVESFLSILKNAAYVVTNSYHATILSIKFEVPFYTYVLESMKSRFETLLSYSDISRRLFVGDIPVIDDDIDFNGMNEDFDRQKDVSIRYLRDTLEI